MARRTAVDTAPTEVPRDLAIGAHIPTWCDPRVLDRLAELDVDDPQRADVVWRCQFSALSRHRAALRAHGQARGLTRMDTLRLVPSRRPYWGEPRPT